MGKVLETDIQIRFADVDSLGHVNNVNLQHYYDLGKMQFYNKVLGESLRPNRESLILVSACTNYYAQTFMHEKIYIETAVEKIGTKSVTFFQRMMDREKGELKSDCRTVAVGFDFMADESIELKDEWKKALEEYLIE